MIRMADKVVPMVALLLSFTCASLAYFFASPGQIVEAREAPVFSQKKYNQYFVQDPKDTDEIINKYNGALLSATTYIKPVKILIVPGHGEDATGAVYNKTIEADLNLAVSEQLEYFLKLEKGIEVFNVRDEDGYKLELLTYFEDNREEIIEFREGYKELTEKLKKRRKFKENQTVEHNEASEEASVKLYGINKWANENYFDMVIHIHFNDYPGRYRSAPGKYNGFSIYVPEEQLPNSEISMEIAEHIRRRLADYFPISNMPKESEGIIEDQELIAIGSNNTTNVPSILLEYGYIYERQFNNLEIKDLFMKEMAYRTYLGIMNFLKQESSYEKQSTFLKQITENIAHNYRDTIDIVALQALLRQEEYYPGDWKTFNQCPISGYVGTCTVSAVRRFQSANGISNTGFVGPITRRALNGLVN